MLSAHAFRLSYRFLQPGSGITCFCRPFIQMETVTSPSSIYLEIVTFPPHPSYHRKSGVYFSSPSVPEPRKDEVDFAQSFQEVHN